MTRTHDIAIYTPFAGDHYQQHGPRGGGAERQTVILARHLVARGIRVAHIVWPLKGELADGPRPTLIERDPYRGERRFGGLGETRSIWRAMRAADARLYLFRSGRGHLFVAAAFCLVHRRKLVYAAANDLDFTPEALRGFSHILYRGALRKADAIVTQTPRQHDLAAQSVPGHALMPMIPSFVEPAEARTQAPDGFTWIGRLAPYKQPLEYAELAAALPQERFRMVYFADSTTPSDLPSELDRRAAELPNLELLGQQPRARVMELIERSHAVVSTSTFEGMPNVFLEAWARGVPALSLGWDPGGRIAGERLGRVADGSVGDLARLAAELARDDGLRAGLGGNARDFVNRVHDPEVVGSRWVDLFRELLPDGL